MRGEIILLIIVALGIVLAKIIPNISGFTNDLKMKSGDLDVILSDTKWKTLDDKMIVEVEKSTSNHDIRLLLRPQDGSNTALRLSFFAKSEFTAFNPTTKHGLMLDKDKKTLILQIGTEQYHAVRVK